MRKLEPGREIGQVAQDMSMTIDHPWHDKGVGKIDHAHARGRFVADALDAMVLDRDENIFAIFPVFTSSNRPALIAIGEGDAEGDGDGEGFGHATP